MKSEFIPRTVAARVAASLVTALGAVLCTGPAAAESACLNDDERKVCLDVTSLPSDTVQPSGMAGDSDTYVNYTATLRIAGNKSSRFVESRFDLSDSVFVSFETSGDVACTLAGPSLSCFADKLEPNHPVTVKAVARTPTATGPFTNTAVFGWQGRTATVKRTVQVSSTSGQTWVPANQGVTLATDQPASSADQQVTPEHPLYGEFTIPAQDHAYFARVAIVTNAPLQCTGGLFLSATEGGPYVCRQPEVPNRWVEVSLDTVPSDTVLQFRLLWDASIVPAMQLPPSPIAPAGVPNFAVFHAHTPTPPPAVASAHAFADACAATPAPPCLTAVTRYETTADWAATGYYATGDAVAAADSPLDALYALLDRLIEPADAVGIKPPIGFQ